ncbi:glycosyltransferase family 2 protein [Frigoriflavimonas asaccharolytica]|uniref:Glycosyltransferase involved in cell wall biosynthesis n=1 Tax=Frigoriflavimonas asaccharolytica TaxID=2735899 RepID=A0A8J8G7E3_9FLAO|nr:glycosyltransferase family 2 protein [Frigoriflavimonas asaccharolytica]NRS92664.1 glycosyltransferase involved in cell wall biosynthesis [Frigoriflavimonas asaccharolytica]
MVNISVIIPVYNASAFLEKAVASALQLEEVQEIILVEDKSTDNSLEICKKLAGENSKIKLFQHPDQGNHGAGASRNLGLEKATQDFIAFLDADDYYLPNRFEAEKKLFQNSTIEGVFGAIGTEFLSEKGKKEFQEKFKNVALTTLKKACEGKEIFRGLIGLDPEIGTFFHLNALTIRRESLAKNKLKFNDHLRVHQDSDFITKLSYYVHLKSGIIDKAIAIRGVHDDNRITKIKLYSAKYNERQFLLWNSLFAWSTNLNLPKEEQNIFYLNKNAFQLATENGLKKGIHLLNVFLKNPSILKTKYRFTYLKR